MRPEDLRRSSNRLGKWSEGRTEESPCEIAGMRCKCSGWTGLPLNPSGPQIGDCRSLESEEPVLWLACGGDLGTPAPRLFP